MFIVSASGNSTVLLPRLIVDACALTKVQKYTTKESLVKGILNFYNNAFTTGFYRSSVN